MHLEEIEARVKKSKRFVILVMEDIDEYLEYGRQNFIYKVLNMFQTSHLPFVFLSTTTVPDVVDLFEKRVKSRFSSHQLLMREESPGGEGFELGFRMWKNKIIDQPETSLDDYKYKLVAVKLMDDPKVVMSMREIAKAHGSFYRLFQILRETLCYFMAYVNDIKFADEGASVFQYLEAYLVNILSYQDEVHKLRSPDTILNCLT